jgi:hypothetical protein
MTPDAIIAALAALVVVVCIAAVGLASKRNALAVRLAATTANLQKYAPLDEIDVEIARRQMTLQTETARASHEIEAARRAVGEAVAKTREEADAECAGLVARVQLAREELSRTEAQLAQYELQLDLEEMAFHQPKFHFLDARQYGDALDLVREAQKELARQKRLLEEIGPGVPAAMKSVGRLAVRAFNGDAAAIIAAVSHENFEASKEKLRRQFETANRLLEPAGLRIVAQYLELKVKEMALTHDHRHAEATTKQAQAAVKETMRKEEEARRAAERSRRRDPAAPRDHVTFGSHDLHVRTADAPRSNGESRLGKH